MTKVSVIIPCYNQARFLPDALASVLAQTLEDWECIVVDDGSPDDTREVALRYAQRDTRIRLVSQENRGLSGARNRGLGESRGEWVQFLDADDILLPDKLQKQLKALKGCQAPSLSFCDYYFCDTHNINTRVTKGSNYEHPRLVHQNPLIDLILRWETDLSIPAHAFLFDAHLFKGTGIKFDEKLPNHEDWDCWVQIFIKQPIIIPVHEELVVYRQHPNSMITDKVAMWSGYEQALKKNLTTYKKNKHVNNALKRKMRQMRSVYLGENATTLAKKCAIAERALNHTTKELTRFYRKNAPWPIQQFLHKFLHRR